MEFIETPCKMNILLKWDLFRAKKDGSTGPTALESDWPYFEIMGQLPGPTINLKAWNNADPTKIARLTFAAFFCNSLALFFSLAALKYKKKLLSSVGFL